MAETDVKKGTVKWFNDQKGFGFMTPEDGTEDLFIHQSSIKCDGFRSLGDGDELEYVLANSGAWLTDLCQERYEAREKRLLRRLSTCSLLMDNFLRPPSVLPGATRCLFFTYSTGRPPVALIPI
ncbi:hypothetical protein BUALT_Bualt10G0004100 [Buddleja alternifolia]|uniref:CSD domain-containing protein n=1 Tax=Buddleja alternifolia TaxID=168488 RepID=A0AAV6WVR9_9LAMI|nr:hypothetical protein BUALT_Bualt10G0004100 [Buddleja alternifolia]